MLKFLRVYLNWDPEHGQEQFNNLIEQVERESTEWKEQQTTESNNSGEMEVETGNSSDESIELGGYNNSNSNSNINKNSNSK